jgi:hypothetical protein
VKGAAALEDPRAQAEAHRQDRHRTEELSDACASVEEDLEVLKARFEMYFLGIERREPAREREEMKRRVAKLKGEFTRNTGLRFRIQTLHARFLSYERMWLRSAREKEAGTYRRDLLRARRHAARQAASPEALPASPAPVPAAPAPAPVSTSPAPVPPPPGEIPEAELRALFAAYVEAKRRCNEDVSRLTYEALARSVAKQVPELMAKHKVSRVEFRVVTKDGRVVLQAVPRAQGRAHNG